MPYAKEKTDLSNKHHHSVNNTPIVKRTNNIVNKFVGSVPIH